MNAVQRQMCLNYIVSAISAVERANGHAERPRNNAARFCMNTAMLEAIEMTKAAWLAVDKESTV